MPGEAVLGSDSWFFGCSACGKCCNSPPRLFLPELFHHEGRFVGCLGVQRSGSGVELFAHAFGFASEQACPALARDGRCSIYDDRRPRICGVVPLDGALPDWEQHAVLAGRRSEAQFWGAECLLAAPAPGFREVTRRLRVVDPEAQAMLAEYRRELANEQRFWVDGVARLLGPELLQHPDRVRALPENGMLVLALTPALALVAETSTRCHERVVRFARTQNQLMMERIALALTRRRTADRADTALLRRLLASNQALLQLLLQRPPTPQARRAELAAAVESWLGV